MTNTSDPASAQARLPYHHGDLRRALIEATVGLVAERGVERVTIREVARLAGVSSGAPFRHFKDKTALIQAVAEEGMARLRTAIASSLAQSLSQPPIERLSAVADAYFSWACDHPTHYRVLGDRNLIGFYASHSLVEDNGWIRAETAALFHAAGAQGHLKSLDLSRTHLQIRALAYGLTRMYVDGHFEEFAITPDAALSTMSKTMKDYLLSLTRSDPSGER